jgi:hypothetical protein
MLEWVFDDLLRFLFPDADRVFDWSAPLSFMDKELARISPEPKDGATSRVVDKLVKVKLRNRAKKYALVHLEVQGKTKKKDRRQFGERMFQYFNLLFAKHPLPLATIAVFTGDDGHLLPGSYSYSFLNTRLPFEYNTINIRDHSDEELSASDNPFAWTMLIAKQALLSGRNREQRLLEMKWVIFQKLYYKGIFEDRKLQAIFMFMEHYLPFDDPKISLIFRKRIDLLTGKKKTMDIFEQVKQMKIEEARQEGVQEGEKGAKEVFVRSLLAETEFSDEKIASLTRVSVRLVASIRKKLRFK